MIRISLYKDKAGRPVGFASRGHAGFAERGQDIVCSAVSVLLINTLNSIEAFAEDEVLYKEDEKKAYMKAFIKKAPSDTAVLFLKSLELGLKEIRDSYGCRFIDISNKEV